MIKNKKADISIVILVIGVLALFGIALFSFYSSSRNFADSFDKIKAIQGVNFIEDKANFYLSKPQYDNADFLFTGYPLPDVNYIGGNFVFKSYFLDTKSLSVIMAYVDKGIFPWSDKDVQLVVVYKWDSNSMNIPDVEQFKS